MPCLTMAIVADFSGNNGKSAITEIGSTELLYEM